MVTPVPSMSGIMDPLCVGNNNVLWWICIGVCCLGSSVPSLPLV